MRLYEDHRPVPAGGGRAGGAARGGAAAGPGAVHPGGLRSQQISQSADTVGMCATALNFTELHCERQVRAAAAGHPAAEDGPPRHGGDSLLPGDGGGD